SSAPSDPNEQHPGRGRVARSGTPGRGVSPHGRRIFRSSKRCRFPPPERLRLPQTRRAPLLRLPVVLKTTKGSLSLDSFGPDLFIGSAARELDGKDPVSGNLSDNRS